MKASPALVALVAVASSLATVFAVELLRGPRPAAAVGPQLGNPAQLAFREEEPSVAAPRAVESPTGYEQRLADLERRLAALELDSSSSRAPVTSPEHAPPTLDELRVLVLDWVAEERAARGRAAELEHEVVQRKELEFDARFNAHLLAKQNDLVDWQEDKLAEVYLQIETRRREIDESVDLESDDPEQVEARYAEFDDWADQLLRADLGTELYSLIHGEG